MAGSQTKYLTKMKIMSLILILIMSSTLTLLLYSPALLLSTPWSLRHVRFCSLGMVYILQIQSPLSLPAWFLLVRLLLVCFHQLCFSGIPSLTWGGWCCCIGVWNWLVVFLFCSLSFSSSLVWLRPVWSILIVVCVSSGVIQPCCCFSWARLLKLL